jgi:protein subunit release factor B
MNKRLLFSVTRKDLIRQTFRSGGKGGQNQNKVESGVRLIHPPSGARGEARDSRDQKTNERSAFRRLVDSKEFRSWHKLECAKRLGQKIPETPEQMMVRVDSLIESGLRSGDIVVEEL